MAFSQKKKKKKKKVYETFLAFAGHTQVKGGG